MKPILYGFFHFFNPERFERADVGAYTVATAMMFHIVLGIIYAIVEIVSAKAGKTVNPHILHLVPGTMLMAA